MHLTWLPRDTTMAGFEVAQIPRLAAVELVKRAVQHFAASPSLQKTDEQWNQAIIRWVNSDWSDSRKKRALLQSLNEHGPTSGVNGHSSLYEDTGEYERAMRAAGRAP